MKTESERIGPIAVQTRTDIKDHFAKHVHLFAQYLTVEPDGDKRVQSLEDQQ